MSEIPTASSSASQEQQPEPEGTTALPITPNDTKTTTGCPNKRTLGEELFLVHLNRYEKKEPSIDDYDFEQLPATLLRKNQERSMSAGEELWNIHCKRSAGVLLEGDDEEVVCDRDDKKPEQTDANNNNNKIEDGSPTKRRKTTGKQTGQHHASMVHHKKTRILPPRNQVLHLRNRQVKIQSKN